MAEYWLQPDQFRRKTGPKSSRHYVTEKSLDKDDRLNQKISKLKRSLKSSSHHTQQLHSQLKMASQQISMLKNENKKLKKICELAHRQKQKLLLENKEFLVKLQYKEKDIAKLQTREKITRQSEIHSRTLLNDQKELEETVKNFKALLGQKQAHIKQLEKKIERQKSPERKSHSLEILQKDFDRKTNEISTLNKEIAILKQNLKQSFLKEEKSREILQQKQKQNKLLHEQDKKNKNIVSVLEKENQILKESKEKLSRETIKYLQSISQLQKKVLHIEFQKKKFSQQNSQLLNTINNLRQQLKKSFQQFQELNEEHKETLSVTHKNYSQFHYEIQKDMERQLHTMAKELARRHLVSQSSLSGSMCPPTPNKLRNRLNGIH